MFSAIEYYEPCINSDCIFGKKINAVDKYPLSIFNKFARILLFIRLHIVQNVLHGFYATNMIFEKYHS